MTEVKLTHEMSCSCAECILLRRLTDRERYILNELARGRNYKEMNGAVMSNKGKPLGWRSAHRIINELCQRFDVRTTRHMVAIYVRWRMQQEAAEETPIPKFLLRRNQNITSL